MSQVPQKWYINYIVVHKRFGYFHLLRLLIENKIFVFIVILYKYSNIFAKQGIIYSNIFRPNVGFQ